MRKAILPRGEIVSLYTEGTGISELRDKYNTSFYAIKNLLISTNVKIRSGSEASRTYSIKENYFDFIDTDEKAYILGLLFADGYNNSNERHKVNLTLKSEDKYMLERISEIFQPKKPLQYVKRTDCWSFTINNKHISETLSNLGCIKAKSLILRFPEFLDSKLYYAFIRGYFDGDGCIYIDKVKQPHIAIVSTLQFCLRLQEILLEDCKITSTVRKHGPNNITHALWFGGRKQGLKFKDYIYKNSTLYLLRKFNKFEQLGQRIK